MTDAGLTHVAIEVSDLQRSIDFYAAYGGFEVVHRRDGVRRSSADAAHLFSTCRGTQAPGKARPSIAVDERVDKQLSS